MIERCLRSCSYAPGLGRDGHRSPGPARPPRAGGRCCARAARGAVRDGRDDRLPSRGPARPEVPHRDPCRSAFRPHRRARRASRTSIAPTPRPAARADEEVLKLLGLIEPGRRPAHVSASVFGEGVAGYYDPRSKRLRIVSGTTPDALSEMVLAHELTHALEDQRFGLAVSEGETDDAALARLALVEGTAMLGHAGVPPALHRGREGARRAARVRLADRSRPAEVPPGPADLPVPRRFGVHPGAAPDRWRQVDAGRPRRSRARARTAPSRSCTRRSGWRWKSRCPCDWTSSLARDWRSVASGTWGEWQTRALLGGARRGRGGVGRRPLRALAARRSAPRRRAATTTCWSCAGAGTACATRASSRPRCGERRRRRCRRGGPRRHRHARAGAHPGACSSSAGDR